MKTSLKTLSRTTLVLIAASMAFTACKKENNHDLASLSANNQLASVPTATNTLVLGNWAKPSSPSDYAVRYFNVITGTQDSTGTIAYHLTFSSNNNLLIKVKPGAGYTLKYLNTTTPFASLTISDYNKASTVAATGLGLNTSSDALNTSLGANGWLNYNRITHAINNTQNVVLFLNDGTTTYVLQATAAKGEGSATLNRGTYTINHGKLVNP